MITGELRTQIDRIWDSFWSGGISNPLEVIEQITFLLFIKRLCDGKCLLMKGERVVQLFGVDNFLFCLKGKRDGEIIVNFCLTALIIYCLIEIQRLHEQTVGILPLT